MKFRKKPVIIEAVQWTGENFKEILDFMRPVVPNHRGDAYTLQHAIIIKTLEGEHIASLNDWIIKGVQGEFYPCKPDIFKQTYEPVH